MMAETPDSLLAALNHPLDAVIQQLRTLIRAVDPSVQEGVKWNAPSYYTVEHFATFHLRSKTVVQVVLHLGAKARKDVDLRDSIAAPDGLVEWRGPDRGIVSFTSHADVEQKRDAFVALLRQWLAFVR